MNHLPQISEAEYEVMKVLWKHAPINTNEVTDMLTKTIGWNPKTIHTLLKRLAQKGAITYEKEGRVFVYTPIVKEDEYLKKANDHFLNRFYNGKISSMVTNYMNNEQLEQDELEELRKLLLNGNREDR
ncbi:transcriptional regulator [Lacrimispora xylanolytica]|jgi:BlaI family penicillinase repressor|uniref:BlaI/MecI/CopY family transcriptional regulator n=1 Tax=Lacrimispora xylanolytica TaxID=29375 RepID=A0ABY7A9F5_9FIRM|nr:MULTISPECIES: BlaI/MecI/CopY family transcriptional regulator [Clostridia]WAJ23186.1 BlaI/MecI/CopY family transcriptional regulator [Lacrimispora xylanolytica]